MSSLRYNVRNVVVVCTYGRLVHPFPYENNAVKLTFPIRVLLRKSFSALKRVFCEGPWINIDLISEPQRVNVFLRKLVVFILRH